MAVVTVSWRPFKVVATYFEVCDVAAPRSGRRELRKNRRRTSDLPDLLLMVLERTTSLFERAEVCDVAAVYDLDLVGTQI